MGAKSSKSQEDQKQSTDWGPSPIVAERKCRDLLFLILYIAFWCGMFVVMGVAFQQGKPQTLIYGVDYNGDVCGVNNAGGSDLSSKKYLFYPVPPASTSYGICVSSCPTANDAASYICKYGVTESIVEFAAQNCYAKYKTSPVFFRCVPDALASAVNATSSSFSTISSSSLFSSGIGSVRRALGDLKSGAYVILISSGIALGLSFFWLLLLRFLAGFMVWFTLIGTILAFAGGGYLSYVQAQTLTGDSYTVYFTLSIVLFSISGLLFLISVFLFKRIRIAVEILREASKAVGAMPTMIIFPAVTYILTIACNALFFVVEVYLASAAKITTTTSGATTTFSSNMEYLQLYNVFAYFWNMNFVAGLAMMTVAGAAASWYFSVPGDNKVAPFGAVWKAFYRVFRYHLGSVAFGSLIIAIVQFIRYLFRKYMKQTAATSSKVVKFVGCIIDCCLACIERFVKFITKNAYIMIAIRGESFCTSAIASFKIITTNVLRVAAVNLVSDFLLFLGKVFIVVVTAIIGQLLLSNDKLAPDLNSTYLPMFAIAIMAFYIGNTFMSVYETCIDTILLCFCVDCEQNDGSIAKPFYMSESLKGITGVKNTTQVAPSGNSTPKQAW